MKSAEVRELLPHAADEVIHRDGSCWSEGRGLQNTQRVRRAFWEGPPQLPLADGRDHDQRSPRPAKPRSGRRSALGSASTEAKDAALEATARLLGERSAEILEANAADLADERAAGLTDGAARPARR